MKIIYKTNDTTIIIIIIIVIICMYIINTYFSNNIHILSDVDNQIYNVKNDKNKYIIANLLAKIRQKLIIISNHLYKHKEDIFMKYKDRIENLHNIIYDVEFIDNFGNESIMTQTVNKGKSIIFCLRYDDNKKIYGINLLTYVALHELSHIVSPTHTIGKYHDNNFIEIFKLILIEAKKIGIYDNINFKKYPIIYCKEKISNVLI